MKKLITMPKIICKIFIICTLNTIATSCSYTPQPDDVLYPICVDGKYGYIDSTGKVIVEPKYLKADIFRNGLGVVITDYNIDSIKRSDKFLQITAQIQQDTSILYSKRITYKYGYLNKKGQFQIEPKLVIRHICGWLEKHSDSAIYHFNELGFSRGLAMYQDTSGKFGYINTHGKVVLAPLYEGAKRFREGLAPVAVNCVDSTAGLKRLRSDIRWGYINPKGEMVIQPKYHSAQSFYNGVATVKYRQTKYRKNGHIEIENYCMGIDRQGNTKLGPYDFCNLSPFYESVAIYTHMLIGCQYINKVGDKITPWLPHNSLTSFNYDRGGFRLNGKWGFINEQAQIVIPPQYDSVQAFNEGLAAVMQNDQWGYIDTIGKQVIPCKYDYVSHFNRGLAPFGINHRTLKIEGYINRQGKIIWQHESLTEMQ